MGPWDITRRRGKVGAGGEVGDACGTVREVDRERVEVGMWAADAAGGRAESSSSLSP